MRLCDARSHSRQRQQRQSAAHDVEPHLGAARGRCRGRHCRSHLTGDLRLHSRAYRRAPILQGLQHRRIDLLGGRVVGVGLRDQILDIIICDRIARRGCRDDAPAVTGVLPTVQATPRCGVRRVVEAVVVGPSRSGGRQRFPVVGARHPLEPRATGLHPIVVPPLPRIMPATYPFCTGAEPAVLAHTG